MVDQLISVAVPRPLRGLFTYRLPGELASQIQIGSCVEVPFGKSKTHAFVVEAPRPLADLPAGLNLEDLKSVLSINDNVPVLSAEILSLCQWAQEYYFIPLGEILQGATPLASKAVKKLKRAPRKVKISKGEMGMFSRHSLTPDQKSAADSLDSYRQSGAGKVALLHGVTGSGKTEVYIDLASRVLMEGKGVLILVPEIALTPQLHAHFEKGLGVPVGLWHSAISAGKRRDQINALKQRELRVIVGARSSIFAPIPDLGLIVVDEEHDPTYKQEERARYHARDLAIVRAKISGAFVLLGSATPSLETQERVREGRYSKVSLTKRITPGGLPTIEWIDLREEEKVEKIQASLALKTIQIIRETLAAGEQVIIYLNRRGFAAFLLCKECGEVKNCSHCSTSLTLHKRTSLLRCHLCGHSEVIPEVCEKCQSTELYPMGAGTESLEVELPQLIPDAKMIRLDRDQVTSATRLNDLLDSFRNREANVLLGTQMLVKGHDFPGVTLVVVVLADALFRWPDFRAPERAIQILKQVSGRAGRGEKKGRVLIQTFDVENPILQVVDGRISEEDFLENERELRKILGYPPFGRLARLRFESLDRAEAIFRSKAVSELLKQRFMTELKKSEDLDEGFFPSSLLEVLGPSEAFLERIKGTYRWDLLIKARKIQDLQKAVNLSLGFCAEHKWQILVDIDPYGI